MTNFFRFFLLIFTAILLACMIGCTRTVYIPTVQTINHTDSSAVHTSDVFWHGWHTTDSVLVRDSIFMMVRGDTVYTDRWHTRDVIRTSTDTLTIWRDRDSVRVVRDSVFIREPYPVEVIKYVEKDLKWWQTLFIWTGALGWAFLLAVGIWVLLRLHKKQP